MAPRVRFAPSPTGYLHIGGARTALFNWLYARHTGGVFVLRIEDTDQERSTPESVQAILDGLKWLGIDWDEGPEVGGQHGPYFQMQRQARYAEVAELLIRTGWAYRDYATEAEVKAARLAFAESKGLKPTDDLRRAGFKWKSPYRDAEQKLASPHVVRFKMPVRERGLGFDDMVIGRIERPFDDLDDFVLVRSDGIPLYNFGCVVDDHDMAISLVGRGQEHINSTLPQLMIYEALNWAPPQFAHLPLILGPNGEKLSKRKHPEADVMLHKNNGMLPEALTDFVVRLGWSHGDDEVITRQQMIEWFDFKDVGKTSGIWNPEKLSWLNQQWLKLLSPEEIAKRMNNPDPRLPRLLAPFRERAKSLNELVTMTAGYLKKGVTLDAAAAAKHLDVNGKAVLSKAREALGAAAEWKAAPLEEALKKVSEAAGIGMGKVAQPVRVAITGNTTSPGIGETLEMLGHDEALARIDSALA